MGNHCGENRCPMENKNENDYLSQSNSNGILRLCGGKAHRRENWVGCVGGLMRRLSVSAEMKLHQLLNELMLGDRIPSKVGGRNEAAGCG